MNFSVLISNLFSFPQLASVSIWPPHSPLSHLSEAVKEPPSQAVQLDPSHLTYLPPRNSPPHWPHETVPVSEGAALQSRFVFLFSALISWNVYDFLSYSTCPVPASVLDEASSGSARGSWRCHILPMRYTSQPHCELREGRKCLI